MVLETKTIAFDEIKIHPQFKNSRIMERNLQELQQHLLANGLLNPLFVWEIETEGQLEYYLIAGFRRYNAIKGIRVSDPSKFQNILVRVYRGDIKGAALLNLSENAQRENLNPVEVCRYLSWLASLGVPQKDMAKMLGKSEGWVSDGLGFLERADSDLIEAVEKEGMSYRLAMQVARALPKPQQARSVEKWRGVLREKGKRTANKSLTTDLEKQKQRVPRIKTQRPVAEMIDMYNRYRTMDISGLDPVQIAYIKGLCRAALYSLNHDIDLSKIEFPELVQYEPPVKGGRLDTSK